MGGRSDGLPASLRWNSLLCYKLVEYLLEASPGIWEGISCLSPPDRDRGPVCTSLFAHEWVNPRGNLSARTELASVCSSITSVCSSIVRVIFACATAALWAALLLGLGPPAVLSPLLAALFLLPADRRTRGEAGRAAQDPGQLVNTAVASAQTEPRRTPRGEIVNALLLQPNR